MKIIKREGRHLFLEFESEKEKVEWIELTMTAYHKMLPQKPYDCYNYIFNHWGGRCPTCDEEVANTSRYCKHCGQKLSWEEERE